MSETTGNRVATTSAWVVYTLIVLEILFMVSPFAAYYYSIYATPLNLLQTTGQTAWLTMYVLPHFTYSISALANTLILISWPLIIIGGVLFVLGFCQIYWSKFTSRGAVEFGLYRHIRHPQYVALALIGLGTTLFWSRFVVGIAFASMLFLYYWLARLEEQICLKKFGESYAAYQERTGMFLPRGLEARWSKLGLILPPGRLARTATLGGLYLGLVGMVVLAGFLMRGHAIQSLQLSADTDRVAVFLAPFETEDRNRVAALLSEHDLPAGIAYVAPSSWQVPELGLHGAEGYEHGGLEELLHPTTHGNSFDFDPTRVSVLLTRPKLLNESAQGVEILSQALGIQPLLLANFDLQTGELLATLSPEQSHWAGIPVPTY